MQYHFHKYNKYKHSSSRNVYPAYNKLKHLNTKTRRLYDKLKDTYGITVGTDYMWCAETPGPIVKCDNCNRRPIENCTSVHKIKLCTVRTALFIGRRPFSFIKGSWSSYPIYYLLCNQYDLHFSDEDTDKVNGLQSIWPDFYWSILYWKDIRNNSSSEIIWKIVPLGWSEWWFDDILL